MSKIGNLKLLFFKYYSLPSFILYDSSHNLKKNSINSSILAKYNLWEIAAYINNYFGLFVTHSFTHSKTKRPKKLGWKLNPVKSAFMNTNIFHIFFGGLLIHTFQESLIQLKEKNSLKSCMN